METTISLERLWQTIRTLPLDNRKWLQSKLQTSIRDEEAAAAPCQYTLEELGATPFRFGGKLPQRAVLHE